MKKFLAMLIALTLTTGICVFVGCGGTGDGNSSSGSNSEQDFGAQDIFDDGYKTPPI